MKRPRIKDLGIWAGAALTLVSIVGCGNLFRPVVTNIPPVQPAPQPQKFAVVISCGNNTNINAANIYDVCAASTAPGLASYVDFAGDSLMVRLNLGNGPRWLGFDGGGDTVYTANADGTISSAVISTTEESNQVTTSTLLGQSEPNALLSTSKYLYVSQPGLSSVAVMTSNSASGGPSLVLEIPITDPANPGIPQNPVNIVGNANAQRVYVISQGANATNCPTSGSTGAATAIESNTATISAVLPLGTCPIYGIMSADNRRTFILNQGSGSVSVIDSQQNQIDQNPNLVNGTILVGNGPVWADMDYTASILAVVNSQSDTLSLINVSTDSFGHDTPNFGQIIATVPVGKNPSSVAVLQDGTRAYVANRGDGTVSVVSLVSNQVLKTIKLPKHPCQAGNPNVLCISHPISIAATTGTPMGKVYVVSPDSNVLTVIRTDNDTIYENLGLTGNGIQVRVTAP